MTTPRLHEVLDRPILEQMRTDVVRLAPDVTVEEALDNIRKQQPSGRIIYFYVADAENRLLGVVPTRRLLLSPRDARLSDLMIRQVISIPHIATVADACEFFIFHKLLAFPVVDEERRLLGVVDVELYTQELRDLDRRESQNDLFQLIGVHLSESQRPAVADQFRRRFPWLLVTLVGGLATAAVTRHFYEVASLAMVVSFIPLVLSLSSSVASQSLSLLLQTTHSRKTSWTELLPKFKVELATGVFLGISCALFVGFAVFLGTEQRLDLVSLLASIVATVSCAALLGFTVPYLANRFNVATQVAMGPITHAINDVVSLVVYFTLSLWLLR